jgi:hypothetical protein
MKKGIRDIFLHALRLSMVGLVALTGCVTMEKWTKTFPIIHPTRDDLLIMLQRAQEPSRFTRFLLRLQDFVSTYNSRLMALKKIIRNNANAIW